MAPDASTSPVEWGPEIRVDGKRPEWLKTGDIIDWQWESRRWHADRPDEPWNAKGVPAERVAIENGVVAIRLPANHPRYRQPTTHERDPALWDRMEALCRKIATWAEERTPAEPLHVSAAEARAIVADLPKPVDPDEQYAADLIREQGWQGEGPIGEAAVLSMIAKAHRDGRELAAPEVSHVG